MILIGQLLNYDWLCSLPMIIRGWLYGMIPLIFAKTVVTVVTARHQNLVQ